MKTPKKTSKKFKAVEKDAVDSPVQDIEWEGEEIGAESDTKLEQDIGDGREIVIRFFEFGANPAVFEKAKPTAQQLFNHHLNGIEAHLWKDGLQPFPEVEPRLMFSKDKKRYRFIIAAIPRLHAGFKGETKTLSQLLTNTT